MKSPDIHANNAPKGEEERREWGKKMYLEIKNNQKFDKFYEVKN